jgi:hypothetical protein
MAHVHIPSCIRRYLRETRARMRCEGETVKMELAAEAAISAGNAGLAGEQPHTSAFRVYRVRSLEFGGSLSWGLLSTLCVLLFSPSQSSRLGAIHGGVGRGPVSAGSVWMARTGCEDHRKLGLTPLRGLSTTSPGTSSLTTYVSDRHRSRIRAAYSCSSSRASKPPGPPSAWDGLCHGAHCASFRGKTA